jgi:uncharacterized protein (TIGR03083 family)
MATSLIPPTDTRSFFRPIASALVDLLRSLPADAWDRPTIAGSWSVRDVVAHLLDTTLRRLSFHRDRHEPPVPSRHPSSQQELVAFINEMNADWVRATRRISPAVLTRLYAVAGLELADFFERCPLDGPPLFPVSWAGEDGNFGWLDIGREFTEQWHHQMQVREAVGAPPLADPAWLRAVLLLALRGLPHAYRETPAAQGTSLIVEIVGAAGGTFTIRRDEQRWRVLSGEDAETSEARAILTDDTAWRLFFNALTPDQSRARVVGHGNAALLKPLLEARSVVV